jgi:hypothetical protein
VTTPALTADRALLLTGVVEVESLSPFIPIEKAIEQNADSLCCPLSPLCLVPPA